MPLAANDLFVFAGAGVSVSMPAGLPVFDWLRDEVLNQLGLSGYVPGSGSADLRLVEVASGLVPEPFMLELSRAGIDVQAWLGAVLSAGEPNAAHHALAQLAGSGARVWTVNFDDMIEKVPGAMLRRVAWPQEPYDGAPLMKPHGSVGGSLIVTAAQVLAGLDGAWLERLRADVDGRLVVFVGYRGRDLDFQSVWDIVLEKASGVVWFDRWVGGELFEADHKRLLLRRVAARGDLVFAPPAPLPPGVPAGAPPNPSWDFAAWCGDHHLADVSPGLAVRLFDPVPPMCYPPLPGADRWARPAVQGLLGDYRGARRSYLRAGLHPGCQRKAAGALATSFINHGGNAIAALLAPAALLARLERLVQVGEAARRKRVSAWSRTGRHEAVLRATRLPSRDTVSTYLILRSEAQRMTGSLDDAAQLADTARTRALTEHHPVRAAHAAFQQCLALLWAERLNEARSCLVDHLKPYAALAASRWVAWADFIAAGLAIRDGAPDTALASFDAAETRFQAEALLDGIVSVKIARLAAHRLRDDAGGYARELAQVTALSRSGDRRQRYYTRRNTFTAESIDLDRAEFTRASRPDLPAAWSLYSQATASRYPLHAALAHLGLALIQTERGQDPDHARIAAQIAGQIGCRLITTRARQLLALDRADDTLRPVFFC